MSSGTDAQSQSHPKQQRPQRVRGGAVAPYRIGGGGREERSKRLSVHALGSIRHLQHQFAKQGGLASGRNPQLGASGRLLPLAIPGYDPHSVPEDLPPSPSPPAPFPDKPTFDIDSQPSLRVRREQVYAAVSDVCERWGLVEMGKQLSHRRESSSVPQATSAVLADERARVTPSPSLSERRDGGMENQDSLVLDLLQTTTSAIRAVQKYFVSLPPDRVFSEAGTTSGSGNRTGLITSARPIPRFSTLGLGNPSATAIPSSLSRRQASSSTIGPEAFPSEADPLVYLRKASLNALSSLKAMDARYRIPGTGLSASEAVLASVEDTSLDSSIGDLSLRTSSSSSVPGVFLEDVSSSEASSSAGTGMGSRGAVTGHLYDEGVTLHDLREEADAIRSWIETVDSLLTTKSSAENSPATPRPSGSASHFAQDQTDQEHASQSLPEWAREDVFQDDDLARVYACVTTHLSPDLLAHLPTYDPAAMDTTAALLDTLSHGQLLCMAYNAVLRKSQRPWGFIPSSSIHDIIALQSRRSSQAGAHIDVRNQEPVRADGSSASSSMMRRVSSEGASTSASDDDLAGSGASAMTRNPSGPTPKVGFTFRRLENLRLFVAAIKLRYGVTVDVDVKRIVQRDAESRNFSTQPVWQTLMREVVARWVLAAAAEKREEEPDAD